MKYERNFYQIKSNDSILSNLRKERNTIGYYSLPYQDTKEIESYATSIAKENIYIIGIGGSTLGTKAIYTFLRSSHKFNKKLFFLDTIDPLRINYLLSLSDLKNSHFIFISKSGNTIEPVSILKYIESKISISKVNSTVITDKKSSLCKFAKKNGIKTFIQLEQG